MENKEVDLGANTEGQNSQIQKSTQKPIFLNSHIRKSKDTSLKIRLQTLIKERGISEADFYKSLGYSSQVWYALSWGIWDVPIETKVKVARALGVDSSV